MANGHEPFLKDIKKHLDDDGPRLIYADWLEEHGDPRGPLIRTLCEESSEQTVRQRYAVRKRARNLFEEPEHREVFTTAYGVENFTLGVDSHDEPHEIILRRGLPGQVRTSLEAAAQLEQYARMYPITNVEISGITEQNVNSFRSCLLLEDALHVRLNIEDEMYRDQTYVIQSLMRSPYARKLRSLRTDLSFLCNVDTPILREFLREPKFSSLEALELAIDLVDVPLLRRATFAQRLRELVLDTNGDMEERDEGMLVRVVSAMPQLELLEISTNTNSPQNLQSEIRRLRKKRKNLQVRIVE